MDLYRDIFGNEFEDDIRGPLKKQTPVIGAGRPGAIPNRRPVTTAASRKEEVRALIEQNLATTNYNQETLDSLAEAMASYTENAIREAGQV